MLLQHLLRSIRFFAVLPALVLVVASTATGYAAQAPSTEEELTVPIAQIADGAGSAALAETDGNPYYGPGWAGPVNDTAVPACPAWYSPHTTCVPSST